MLKRILCSVGLGLASMSGLLLTGCAVGNTHHYHDVVAQIPYSSMQAVGVGTHDRRGYVLNGDKNPNFVGLQRGGYGNPFNVGTASGKALANDMTTAISTSLSRQGYKPVPVTIAPLDEETAAIDKLNATKAPRAILLTLNEWKSDTMQNTALLYDVTLKIFDETGKVLAEKTLKGKDDLKGSFMNPPGHAKIVIPEAFRRKLEELFSDPDIKKALE